ncbi:hypothetical protein JHK85_023714 [Glycine max]|nr:hypothetical protein JHK85_023714 [Glycine max]
MSPPDYDLGDKSYRHMEPTSSSRMGEIRAAYSRTQNWPSFANPLYDSGITDRNIQVTMYLWVVARIIYT